jgi:hypothetical protein
MFLLWLLIHRLALGLPTALQIHSSYAILFHQGGVSQFKDPNDRLAYEKLGFPLGDHRKRIWALIDTNPGLLEPGKIFRHNKPFFVVDATSPFSDHVELFDKVPIRAFYMKPWSLSEIIQVYVDPAPGDS